MMIMYRELNFDHDEVLEYLRKSRSDDPALSVDEVLLKHERQLDEYAKKHLNGSIPMHQIYREVASSETIDGRPEMLKILKMIESPRIKAILVVDVQRLSRGDLEDAGRLIKLLRYTNTAVITPQKSYDLQDEYDRDFFERELKRGNEYLEYYKKIQARGRGESIKEGNFISSRPPYGYDRTWVTVNKKKCPTLVENKEQADVVRMIFDMYVNQNKGFTLIAKHLDSLGIKPPRGKHWSSNSMADLISNVSYIGKVRWNWRQTKNIIEDQIVKKTRPRSEDYIICEGKHEGIIPEDLFAAAQEKKGRNTRTKVEHKVRNPFAGIVYCRCGHSMTMRTYKRKDGSQRSAPRLLCQDQAYCGYGSVTYDEIMERVCKILEENIHDFEVKLKNNDADAANLHRKMIASLEEKLKTLDEKELRQWDMYSMGEMPKNIFDRLNKSLQDEKSETRKSLKVAYETLPTPEDYQDKLARFRDALHALNDPDLSAEVKNNYLKKVFKRIICTRESPVRISRKNCKQYGYDPNDLEVGGKWYAPPLDLEVIFML